MTNKSKALKRELARLRTVQNPQQIDFRRMRKLRRARRDYWKLRKRIVPVSGKVQEKEEKPRKEKAAKPEKKAKVEKKKKEPEIEIIPEVTEEEVEEEVEDELEEEPEIEVTDEIDEEDIEE